MDLGLKGKVVLVGGASKGIGLAIAEAFLKEEARVVISARSKSTLETAEKELNEKFPEGSIFSFPADLSIANDCAKLLTETHKKFGLIECLVCNAGGGGGKLGLTSSETDWQEAFSKNFLTARTLAEQVIPTMVNRSKGSVVFIGSIASLSALPAPLPYTAAKTALKAYSKSLASLLAEFNIRVNYIAPGNVFFKGGTWDRKLKENKQLVLDYLKREVPLNRFATCQEIASATVFISSEQASFITGECLSIDGGQTKGI